MSLRNKSVLVLIDDPVMSRTLNEVLSGEGAKVTSADCTIDAVAALNDRRKKVNLVITELRTPFSIDITLVYSIRKIYPDLPVIVLSAFSSPDVKAECLRQGAAAVLERPHERAQLFAAVAVAETVLTRSRGQLSRLRKSSKPRNENRD